MNKRFQNIDVVRDAANSANEEIRKLCENIDNAHFYCLIDYIAKLMAKAHLTTVAGGVITWERCLLGLPSIVVIVAENQYKITYSLEKGASTVVAG